MESLRKVNHIQIIINNLYIREIDQLRKNKYKILLNLYLRIKILIDSNNYESALILLEKEKEFRINNFDMNFLSSEYIDIACSAMDLRELLIDYMII